MTLIHEIRLPFGASEKEAVAEALKKSGYPPATPAFVYRKSLDTRRGKITEVFSVALTEDFHEFEYDFSSFSNQKKKVLVVGFGPAGIFAAYLLAKCGFCPIIAEKGKPVDLRVLDVESFWKTGVLNPESNVQFGEGGAGTFSDGKLTTRINDARCRFVLNTFVKHGASPEILKLSKPHIGTDILRKVVVSMRNEILRCGGKILFETSLTDIKIENGRLKEVKLNGEPTNFENVILAIGNGAKNTYEMLLTKDLFIENKPFSVGFRVEYLQEHINNAIYGKNAEDKRLPPAEYQFSTHINGETVYTFCMCPGGFVVNASSDEGFLVTNGMSYSKRDSKNANAALLAAIDAKNPRQAIEFRAKIERAAFLGGNGFAPVSLVKSFLNGEKPQKFAHVSPTFAPDVCFHDFSGIFPEKTLGLLKKGLTEFGKKIYHDDFGVITGVETRTSSPLRIKRDEFFQAVGAKGLYPCGEGAGYAGGIISAAVDGLRVAEKIIGIEDKFL